MGSYLSCGLQNLSHIGSEMKAMYSHLRTNQHLCLRMRVNECIQWGGGSVSGTSRYAQSRNSNSYKYSLYFFIIYLRTNGAKTFNQRPALSFHYLARYYSASYELCEDALMRWGSADRFGIRPCGLEFARRAVCIKTLNYRQYIL